MRKKLLESKWLCHSQLWVIFKSAPWTEFEWQVTYCIRMCVMYVIVSVFDRKVLLLLVFPRHSFKRNTSIFGGKIFNVVITKRKKLRLRQVEEKANDKIKSRRKNAGRIFYFLYYSLIIFPFIVISDFFSFSSTFLNTLTKEKKM